jgi:hypothetical protein
MTAVETVRDASRNGRVSRFTIIASVESNSVSGPLEKF